MRFKPVDEPWVPNAGYDWETGGRMLSAQERKILRRLIVEEKPKSENLSTDSTAKPLGD